MAQRSIDVLVASSYYLALDPKQVRKMRPYPPLGTLYAAAMLRDAGYRVAVFDAMLQPDESAFALALDAHRPRVVALCEDNFNFLSKMCLSRMREAALRMADMAREHGCLVLAAGPDATDHPEPYLTSGVDFVLAGEPEHGWSELLAATRSTNGALDHVPGLVRMVAGELRRNRPRAPERQPDVFAAAAWDLIDIEPYREVWQRHHGYFSLNLATTRGCPFHCNWCAKPIWGQRYAMRSPDQVATELAWVKQHLRPDHIWFADDIFGLRPDWVAQFADRVEALSAHVPFTVQTRIDLITEVAADGLARAGCREAWLGVESGNQRILDAMDKGIRVEAVGATRERLRQRGIRACFFLQFGYPGEGFDEIMDTVRMVQTTLPDDVGISVSYPLPGTVFHQRVAEQMGEKRHWVDSDELAMLFRGSYDSAFYRRIHTLLHADLVVRQCLAAGQTPPADGPSTLAELEDAWAELAAAEPAHRQEAPTQLAEFGSPAPPDLTRWHN